MKVIKYKGNFFIVDNMASISVQEVSSGKYELYLNYGSDVKNDITIELTLSDAVEAELFEKRMFRWLNYRSSTDVFDIEKMASDVRKTIEFVEG